MIQRGEIDGIPVLSTPDGPVAAGITFRVGYADEVLARSGVTHLIEHLAMHRLGVTNYHYNGTTEPLFTSFFSQGSPESVTRYLEQVCDALTALPMDRLEIEKGILRTEAEGRGGQIARRLSVWRYGARGPALSGFPEWGLSALGPDDLQSWVGRFFTRENAVVWFTGMEMPSGLRLSLPGGMRQPAPVTPDALPVAPAYVPLLPKEIAYQVSLPRSTAAKMYCEVLERELFRRLRQDGGYSYSVSADYRVTGAESAEVVAFVDIAEGKEAAAVGEFVDVLATLRWGTIDAAEIADVKAQARAGFANPQAEASGVPWAARTLLLGTGLEQAAELLAGIEAVTPADVQRVAEEAAPRALLLTPGGVGADWAGFTRAPDWSDAPMIGQPIVATGEPGRTLVISQDGVSESTDGVMAVRFADCQAMLVWPDGGRLLVGGDAISCRIEPTLYPLPPGALDFVDQRVPQSRVVRMPARAPGDIPSPPVPEPAAPAGPAARRTMAAPGAPLRAVVDPRPARRAGGGTIAAIVVLGILEVILLLWAIVVSVVPASPEDGIGYALLLIISWVPVVVCGGGIWALARRLRRR